MKIGLYWEGFTKLSFGILTLCLAVSGCSSQENGTRGQGKPNVLLIVTDDQGYGDFSAYGGAQDASTPHMDKMAAQGVRFSNAYASMSICSPSRCGILTGRQQQRWGVYNYGASLPSFEITLAELLKQAGYKTGMVGKSHYGGYVNPDKHEFPTQHGFDSFFGKQGGTMDYLRHKKRDREPFSKRMANHLGIGPFWENGKLVDREGYATDLITGRATQFIEESKDTNFFLMVSFNEVHLFTHQLPDTALVRLGLEKVPDWDPVKGTWDEYLEWYVNTVKPNTPQGRKRYLWHLQQLDVAIGKLIGKLEETGIDNNTIIAFVSDNGGSPRTYSVNDPLKGNKYILEEGGIRIPMVLSWPGHIPKGKVFEPMVSALDIFPTIASALELSLPGDRTYDGMNLLPYLSGESKGIPHERLFWTGISLEGKQKKYKDPNSAIARHDKTFYGDLNGWAVREGKWKLRYYGTDKTYGLFDLSNDIGEKVNLYEKKPKIAAHLKKAFEEWHGNIQKEQTNREK